MSLTNPNHRENGVLKRQRWFRLKHAYAQAFRDAELDNIAGKLTRCEEFEIVAACSHCGAHWWTVEHCRSRVCPLCAYTVQQERSKYIIALCKRMKHPKLLTLTMPTWTQDPHEGIRTIRMHWNTLRRTEQFLQVKGGAYQIELKPKDNGWHIHIHVIMDAPYLAHQTIFSNWRTITGVDVPQIDIRAATTNQSQSYVAKYITKSSGIAGDDPAIVAWYKATLGQRLFATFGQWYNATLEELLNQEPLDEFKPQCKQCGETGTTYYARDGPRVFGNDAWRTIEKTVLIDGQWSRYLTGTQELIDATIPKEEKTPEGAQAK